MTPAELDDAALVAHLRECFDNAAEGHELHFELHGTDLAPLGDLIAHCKAWNITPNEAMATLQGASPASVAPTGPLAELAKLVADAPTSPRTLDDIRALGPAARDALDEFLDEYGWRIVTGYDIRPGSADHRMAGRADARRGARVRAPIGVTGTAAHRGTRRRIRARRAGRARGRRPGAERSRHRGASRASSQAGVVPPAGRARASRTGAAARRLPRGTAAHDGDGDRGNVGARGAG